ncbi:hypothetical protein KQI15_02260 [Intestinimonas butyriciproducens]|uniref:hypothetical protein n=1 Tax=Intestinimonas butyriciproducens TaxID=1297617 RepID=UPI001C0F5B57|nr:hypothetical protein [Intestinimonas butyriciproducens]MBU5228864.1 hypothetical protein [Intestinimonas butyriciproducens]
MDSYKEVYLGLFNAVTDCIESLRRAQQEAEERYLAQAEEARSAPEMPTESSNA